MLHLLVYTNLNSLMKRRLFSEGEEELINLDLH